ncbi:unnamed protein product [Paramecium pentaurelia]|uniref:EGF-like domain-containing protein n=1 Tax=Paramecium pentaurelia TaxID=43138 RepID=A0A8S1TK31_9CILI|nr:unnamed protein product [Paramecium pentaurelia]
MITISIYCFLLIGIIKNEKPCLSPCQTCNGGSGTCKTCKTGFILNDNSCICQPGYYTIDQITCIECLKPCATCLTNGGGCSTCLDTSNQIAPSCSCKEGYIMNTSTHYCQNCPNNCKICSSTSVCTQCHNNYWNNGGICSQCLKPCINCSSNSNCTTCIDTQHQTPHQCKCAEGYVMNTVSYICDLCQFPCNTCQTTVNHCLTCASTYTINSTDHKCSCLNNEFESNSTPKTCQSCTSPCQTCSTSATNCTSCVDGLNRKLENTQCICEDGYYENITCLSCKLPCINCLSELVCTSCKDPIHQSGPQCVCPAKYYMNTSFNCESCISPCLNCISELQCISCEQNYYITDQNCIKCELPCYNCVDNATKCISCAFPNQIVSNDTCVCNDGYFMDPLLLSCQPCIHPCSKCQDYGNYCTDCAITFVMSTSIPNSCVCPNQTYEVLTSIPTNCQSCTQPCDTCSGTGNHCLTCIDINQSVDTSYQCQCNSGYTMIAVNCIVCLSPCLQCLGNSSHCTQCKDPLHQISNGECICPSGYLNDNDYNCIPCQPPCSTCSVNDTYCDSCIDSNHEINDTFQCICKDTFYSDTINTCQQCIQPCFLCDLNGCLSCIDTNQIIDSFQRCVCKQGYYEVGVNCSQCVVPCQTCEINQDHCLSCVDVNQNLINNNCICNDGYFEINHLCQQCQYPCTKCEFTNDHCLECLDINHDLINNKCICKFGFGSSGIDLLSCQPCEYPCLDCSTSTSTCISCTDNNIYYLEDYKCLCKQGYFQVLNQCMSCSPQCSICEEQPEKCLSCSDPNHYLEQNNCICKLGYYSDNNMKCFQCQLPCVTCISNQDYCTSCIDQDNQFLNDGICQCKEGYYISNFKCELCTQFCKKCNSNDECIQCQDGYILQNALCTIPKCIDNYFMNDQGECIQCIQNCQICNDPTSCLSCFDQFYYDNQSCISCSNKCQTCINDSNFCTSCKDLNQLLIDNQCICKEGYYEKDQACEQCDNKCKICNNLLFCTLCNQIEHLVLTKNQCVCEDGYFEFNNNCQLCNKICQTCSQISDNCLSCNQQLYRKKEKNTCICQNGYFENENQECWPCNSDEGKIIKDCQYKNCSDNIWTFGEDCDDGNDLLRDGCSNCQIDQNYTCINTLLKSSLCFKCTDNCIECQMNEVLNQLECIKCNYGFYIQQNQCVKCAEQCLDCKTSASNCLSCRYQNNKLDKCQLCQSNSGYYPDQINNKCYTKCGDSLKTSEEECDDGNLLPGDGCNQFCKIEKKFLCQNGICIIPEYPVPLLFSYGDTSLYNKIRKFKIEYNVLLNVTQYSMIEKSIKFYIKNQLTINPIDIPYQLQTQYSLNNNNNVNFSLIIEILFNRSTKNERLLIKYYNASQIISHQGYQQITTEIETVIQEYIQIDESDIAQVGTATSSNQILLYIMAVMAGGAILFGGLEIFYNLLDTIQMLSYLKYINTQYPYNLQSFFEFFGFAQLSFISKYLKLQQLIDPYIAYEKLKPIPEKIQQDDMNSLFIINGSSIVIVWLSLLGIYIISNIVPIILSRIRLKYYNEIPGKLNFELKCKFWFLALKIYILELCCMIVQEFFYSGIIRTFIATAYDYSFSMTLQLSALELDSQDNLVKLSSYLALFALGIYLFTIYLVTMKCGDPNILLERNQNKFKYMSLFEGIKNKMYSKYYNAISLIQKLSFILILIFGYQTPVYQTINLLILSILQIIYLFVFKPLDDCKEFIKQFSCEINKAIAILFILGLVFDQESKILSDDLRSIIGWICIGNISFILVIQIIIDAIQQWMLLIKKYKKLRRYAQKFYNFFVPPRPNQVDHRIFTIGDFENT